MLRLYVAGEYLAQPCGSLVGLELRPVSHFSRSVSGVCKGDVRLSTGGAADAAL